jgi:hypothetical protein
VKAKAHLLDSLYKNLNTLDNKAVALLTFCGLALTSVALLISSTQTGKYKLVLNVLFIGIIVAAVLTLFVIDVHWTNADELSQRSLDDACKSYYSTRQRRTKIYMLAWFIIIVMTITLGLYMLIDILLSQKTTPG